MIADINLNWKDANDPIMLYGDTAVRQSIYNILFYSKNDIYYGKGDEIDLQSKNFELIPFHGDTLTIRAIAQSIKNADGRLRLDERLSKITPVGDQYRLHLVIQYDSDKQVTIDQVVESK